MREAAIESSRWDDSKAYLNFAKKVKCEVKVRSKVKMTIFWTIGRGDQTMQRQQAQTQARHFQMVKEGTAWVWVLS